QLKLGKGHNQVNQTANLLINGWIIFDKDCFAAVVAGLQVIAQCFIGRRVNRKWTKKREKILYRLFGVGFGVFSQLFMWQPDTGSIQICRSLNDQKIGKGETIQKQGSIYPAKMQSPSCNIRRIEQFLSQKGTNLRGHI